MRSARLALALLLTTSFGCAQKDWIDRTLVTENVAGAWTGSFGEGNSYRELRLDLQQEGSKVTGFATIPLWGTGGTTPLQGNMAGDVFTFNTMRGSASGELTVTGDDMSGQVAWIYGSRRASLHRVDSLPRTETPPR
jgi:hypothetical protein